MELGHYQLEVLISAGLLVCMVIAALMCDLLKSKNEQLREMMVELKVRNEEAGRREQMLLERPVALANAGAANANFSSASHAHRGFAPVGQVPQPADPSGQQSIVQQSIVQQSIVQPSITSAAASTVSPAQAKTAERKTGSRNAHRDRGRSLSPGAAAAIQRGVEMAVNPKTMAARIRPAASVPAPTATAPVVSQTGAIPAALNAPSVKGPIRIAMHPAKKSSVSIAHLAQVSAVESTSPSPVLQAATLAESRFVQRQVRVEEVETVVVGNQTIAAPGDGAPKMTLRSTLAVTPAVKKNWGALLNKTEKKTETADSGLLAAIVAATTQPQTAESTVPAGYHDGFVLTQLVKSHQPLSGLVVSIGVSGEMTTAVSELMRSLLGATDFGCQSGADEFLLIYPGERGAAAQRKLSSIAQQLWSFQLSSLGECSIVFSWGGLEVRSEAVEMAIASASDRMQETRRGRSKAAISAVPNVQAA